MALNTKVFTFPRLIHMESMESMLAEASANLLFHGHHGFHMEWGHIHLGFHGQVHMDSMEQVHMDSMDEITYGKYHDVCCQK